MGNSGVENRRVFCAMAQFARALIRECGPASRHSRANGKRLGRPRVVVDAARIVFASRFRRFPAHDLRKARHIGIGAFCKAAQSRSEKVSPASGILAQRERYWADAQIPTW